jgi:hypothetical protein
MAGRVRYLFEMGLTDDLEDSLAFVEESFSVDGAKPIGRTGPLSLQEGVRYG